MKSMEIVGGVPEQDAGWQRRFCHDSDESDHIIIGIMEQIHVMIVFVHASRGKTQ